MDPDKITIFQVAETSAALMESITSNPRLYDDFYEARENHDGMVGMWTSCAFVAMSAQTHLAPLWESMKRDFISDIHRLATHMVYWQKAIRLIEGSEEAEKILEDFVEGYPNQ